MKIVASAEYIPPEIADNGYFSKLTGKPEEWFERRTGIVRRRRAAEGENTNTMAVSAVARLVETTGVGLQDVDLIVGASYTPWDTIGTMAHAVQRQFGLRGARAIYLSTACSSFINALELAAAYFESGRSRCALIVAAEHNSLYARDDDAQAGHLWGDAAVAVLVEYQPTSAAASISVVDIATSGLADIGHGPEGVYLEPRGKGLVMPHGKDVFQHACREMEGAVRSMLERNDLSMSQIRLLAPHQANDRILSHVAEKLAAGPEQIARSISELGNTGCAGAAIALFRCQHLLQPGDLAMLVTFGGGYSVGCALLRQN